MARTRVRRRNSLVNSKDRSEIEKEVDALVQLDQQISKLQQEYQDRHAKLADKTIGLCIDHVTAGLGTADVVESFSNSRTEIHPEEYMERVDLADFFSSISVSVTKAKQFLGEKELQSISDITPRKSQGKKLVIKAFAVPKSKK